MSPDHRIFSSEVWQEIAERLAAEQKALQLKEFYRNLTEWDKRWLAELKIRWSAND
jgi:hypothetical protein